MTPMIGFAGLTHLGLVSSIAIASKGFRVVGFDPDAERVAEIAQGKLPVVEPGLDQLARNFADNLAFTAKAADLGQCDIVYIATDVPTDDRGASDLAGITALIDDVIPALAPRALLVVLCQVPPGYTRRLKLSPERLYYQVETLVFGRAVERAARPERYIVGCADPEKPLPAPYRALLDAFACPVLPMRYESAELAKISINCCLVASVTVANTLAELSERLGADWSEIVPALRLDRRIGPYSYLAPGLGIAGGNLERDLATVLRLSEAVGSEASVISAFVVNSRHRRDWALRTLHREVLSHKHDAVIGVLGLAYKEDTHSTKNSPALALIECLHPWRVRVYDPVVPAVAAPHPSATGAASALEAALGADVVAIMTPWPEFRKIDPAKLRSAMRGRTVLDPFRVVSPAAARAVGLEWFTLGAPAPARS
ncbi:MAG TPA: nucleotide sugar dehydrogenase [Casimicrobiaceae bacterium]|nr:nucleotide sugar dehydrogenase [Casimicrobiaceae bacterium]